MSLGSDSLLIHRCRFVQTQPSPITALTINDEESLLAIARDDQSIEIWNLDNDMYQERVIAGHGSIRRISFLKSSNSGNESILAASDLNGNLRLYDISTQSRILEHYVGCGPIWDQRRVTGLSGIAKRGTQLENHELLALAGDDGTVRLVFVPFDSSNLSSRSMILINNIILRAGSKRILSVDAQLSPDKKTLWVWAGSEDGHLYRWDVLVNGNGSKSDTGLDIKTTAPTSTVDLPIGSFPWTLCIYKSEALPGQVLNTGPHHVVVGDSDGKLSIWDGALGVLLQTLHHHKADILQVTMSPSQNSIFAVGVDNSITLYQRDSSTTASSKGSSVNHTVGSNNMSNHPNNNSNNINSMDQDHNTHTPWVFVAIRRSHTHDILAAVGSSDRLFTGGIDTKLIVHDYQDMLKVPGRSYLPFSQNPSSIASLAYSSPARNNKNRLVVQLNQKLQIWRLGKPLKSTTVHPKDNHCDVLEGQLLLLEISPKVIGRIMCHASSSMATKIAYSDSSDTKVFHLRESNAVANNSALEEASNMMDVDSPSEFFSEALLTVEKKTLLKGRSSRLAFTSNDLLLRVTSNTHLIQAWDVSDADRPTLRHTFHEHTASPSSRSIQSSSNNSNSTNGLEAASDSAKPIHLLACSKSGKYFASSDLNHRVIVFSLESYQPVLNLPPFEDQVTALAFDPEEQHLAIALSSNIFWIYNIATQSITQWSNNHSNSLPNKLISNQEKIIGLIFHPTLQGLLFAYGHSFMFYTQTTSGSSSRSSKMINSYQPLFADFIDSEGIAVIERPWLKIVQSLPPPFYRQRYGT